MLEDVRDPLGIPFVRFLPANRFDVLGVCQNNAAGRLQDIVDRNPILSGGLHAHILAVVLRKPRPASAQIPSEGREPFALVSCHSLFIGGSNTGNQKRLVDIYPAADTVNDFEHNTSPRNSI